ncbi:MAG TPA: hypothetical protein VJ874_05475 [Candidatus Thermoplasmatota archaeon]|nr:hypothetical protein [Candidatus Thermoplasmatota archaeon]
MGGPIFVEVRVPGFGTVGAAHTRRVPEARIDGVLEATSVDAMGARHTLLALLRGFSQDQVGSLVTDMSETYGEPARVLDLDEQGEAVIRYTVAIRDLRSPPLRAMARFQRAMGVPWMTAREGEVLLYAEAPTPERGAEAVDRVRRYLSDHGVPGQVDMRTATAEDRATHDRLLALLRRFGSVEANRLAAEAMN